MSKEDDDLVEMGSFRSLLSRAFNKPSYIKVYELLAGFPSSSFTATEISKLGSIPKSTVYVALNHLTEMSLIINDNGKYHIIDNQTNRALALACVIYGYENDSIISKEWEETLEPEELDQEIATPYYSREDTSIIAATMPKKIKKKKKDSKKT